MHAIFSHARKGALLLNVATVTVYDVRELDPEFELTCLAVAGGYNAASAAARTVGSRVASLENFYKNFYKLLRGTVERWSASLEV